MFWKSSNIDIQLLDNVSAKCFSIGYHFDDDNILLRVNTFTSIYPLLTVNTSCFHDKYEVSNFYVEYSENVHFQQETIFKKRKC